MKHCDSKRVRPGAFSGVNVLIILNKEAISVVYVCIEVFSPSVAMTDGPMDGRYYYVFLTLLLFQCIEFDLKSPMFIIMCTIYSCQSIDFFIMIHLPINFVNLS